MMFDDRSPTIGDTVSHIKLKSSLQLPSEHDGEE